MLTNGPARIVEAGLATAAVRSARWLRDLALPLWASRGFDTRQGAFEERLDFSFSPVLAAPRRVMVQARQISVYAAAALAGLYPDGRPLALRAARAMIATYLAADGAPGWIFSVDRAGKTVDAKRDLYAHAFVLFALAWVMRLEADPAFVSAARDTLDFLDSFMADPVGGGYWDCLPRIDAIRRQNPHMHLFEAAIALHETNGDARALALCRALKGLALARFFDPTTGALREAFDDRWAVHPRPGAGSVEPGHLFEWAWLLRRYEVISGDDQSGPVSAMIAMAMRYGLDSANGRIIDEIGEDGAIRVASSRSWPHAEALKALSAETGPGDVRYAREIALILGRLSETYCPDALNGGWIDHVDAQDRSISEAMPASTLYHLYFGINSAMALVRGLER